MNNINFFAVYDGHGGKDVSKYLKDRSSDFLNSKELNKKFEDFRKQEDKIAIKFEELKLKEKELQLIEIELKNRENQIKEKENNQKIKDNHQNDIRIELKKKEKEINLEEVLHSLRKSN